MAEQTAAVKSGFYDSIDRDRLYSADQMNMPYKRVIADGVFATPSGEAGTDFQILAISAGVEVLGGNALLGGRWVEAESPSVFEIPVNSTLSPRYDGIFLRVDTRADVRAASLVYRTGSASAAPGRDTTAGVFELRIGTLEISSGASSVPQSQITDGRGSAECPWVTGLISQVDTSTLWEQYKAAYAEQYAALEWQNAQYMAEQRQAWADFLRGLVDQLHLTPNTVTAVRRIYTSDGVLSYQIPSGIYNPQTDMLLPYINGIFAPGRMDIAADGTSLTLYTELPEGNVIDLLILKSVSEGDIASTTSMVMALDQRLSEFTSDSGWLPLSLGPGVSAVGTSVPSVRSVGGQIWLRGEINLSGVAAGDVLATIPQRMAPEEAWCYPAAAGEDAVSTSVALEIDETGELTLRACPSVLAASLWIRLDTTYPGAALVTSVISDLPDGDTVGY